MATTVNSTTVAELAHDLRNAIMGVGGHEGAGALTFIVTSWAAWWSGAARRKVVQKRDPRTARMRAADKARVNLKLGAAVVFDGAAALVQSTSRAGVVHRVEEGRCTCEAGQAARPCWHVEAARQERRNLKARRLQRIAAVIATLKARQSLAA